MKVFNPDRRPVVIDDGRVIAAGEHVEVTNSPKVDDFVARGRLIATDPAPPDPTPTKRRPAAQED